MAEIKLDGLAQPFFQPFGGNDRNWIFRNLEFSWKFLEFSQKILEFSEKFLEFDRKNLKFSEKWLILGWKIGIYLKKTPFKHTLNIT